MEEEQYPSQSLFKSNGDERGNTTQRAVDGGEERIKKDSSGTWRRPATAGWGDDERMPRLVPSSVIIV